MSWFSFVIGVVVGWITLAGFALLAFRQDDTAHREEGTVNQTLAQVKEINRHYWQGYVDGLKKGQAKPGSALAEAKLGRGE